MRTSPLKTKRKLLDYDKMLQTAKVHFHVKLSQKDGLLLLVSVKQFTRVCNGDLFLNFGFRITASCVLLCARHFQNNITRLKKIPFSGENTAALSPR